MKVRNIIFSILILIGFTGCRYGEPTYEEFVHQRNFNVKYLDVPNCWDNAVAESFFLCLHSL